MRTYSRKRPYRERIENPLELCRLCLGKVVQGMPVFNEESDYMPHPLSVRIYLTVGIQVTPDENLPCVICMDCYIEVHRSYIFLKQCEVSQQKLASHVRAAKAKNSGQSGSLAVQDGARHKGSQTEQSMFNVAESTFVLFDEESLKYEIYNVVTLNGVSRTICTKLDQNLFHKFAPRYVAQDVEYSAVGNIGYLNRDLPNTPVDNKDSKMARTTIIFKKNGHLTSDTDTEDEKSVIDLQEPNNTTDPILPIYQPDFLDNQRENSQPKHTDTDVFANEKTQLPELVAAHETDAIALALSNTMDSETNTEKPEISHGPSLMENNLKSLNHNMEAEPLEIELRQNTLADLTENVIIMGDSLIPFATVLQDDGMADSSALTQSVNVSDAISNLLLELGIVTQRNGVLVLEGSGKINLKTNDGENVTLQVVEEAQLAQLQGIEKESPKDVTAFTAEAEVNEPTPEVNDKPQSEQASEVDNNSQDPGAEQEPNRLVIEKPRRKIKRNKDTWCDVCRKYFTTPSVLQRHARVHSGEKPYACDTCGRKFTQKEIMKRHQLVHQSSRPYQCDSCPKSFTQRGSLTSHMRSHVPAHSRNNTEHKCTLCPKTFMHASGLSRHMCAHTGRTYVCLCCNRAFGDKSSLLRHMKSINHIVQKQKVSDTV